MRATLSRAAITLLLSASLVGCKSGSNMFAWMQKKSDGGDAPKYASSTTPVLPSANPNAAATSQTPGQMAAAVTAATPTNSALSNYGSTAQTTYPKTPFEPAKLGGAPAANSSTPIGNTGVNASGYANGGFGTTAAATTPQSYGTPASYGAPATTIASAAQPQNGMYNSAYGGATPAAAPAQYAAAPAAAPAAMAAPAYRTADARGGMSGTADPAAQAGSMVGDRYSNAATPYVDPANIPAAAQPYTPPAASAPAAAVGDRYSQPAPAAADPAAYTPGATGYQPGNTGYNPPDAYSPAPASAGAAPARPDSGYRPGGTSNFTPSAAAKPAGTSEPPSSGVRPASFQSADAATGSQAWPPTSSTLPPTGSEMYGSYQGSTSASEPAYSASTPVASAPGLFPTR